MINWGESNMKTKILSVFCILLIALLATSAAALPIGIEKVEIDDTTVNEGTVRLDVERGQEIEIEITLVATEDIEDVEIKAFISGYEYNSYDTIADSIGPIDMDADVRYKKTLNVELPEDVEGDDYQLRLIISDRNGEDMIVQNYQIKIDLPRHQLKIKDITFHPTSTVKAGTALLGQVRIENQGEKDEDDVMVKMMIPDLGITATDYIDEIESGEQEETEEMYLRLPECAEAGVYQIQVYVGYDNNHKKALGTGHIQVEANDRCQKTEDTVIVMEVIEPDAPLIEAEPTSSWRNSIKTVLEVVLLILVALLVVIGLIIGFTRLGRD
jgi:hypothetical protein